VQVIGVSYRIERAFDLPLLVGVGRQGGRHSSKNHYREKKHMSQYRIVCTEQTNCTASGHIIAVGVGDDASSADDRWTVHQVWNAMDSGDVFYTVGENTGKVALVHKYDCPCGRGSLRSESDATTDNNLDYLRMCRWKS